MSDHGGGGSGAAPGDRKTTKTKTMRAAPRSALSEGQDLREVRNETAPDDDYDEEEDPFYDEDEVCADCGRIIRGEDLCGVCGAAMCFACFEMGCGVCKGPHR